jgi:hypothetical protein
MATFRRAAKHAAKLRMALAGPAGAGKTYTAMTLAAALSDGEPFAVIDTEHGSASKYADIFTFDVLELDSYHPDRYVEAIRMAEAAGYRVLVVDSLSHAWSGKDGILEQVERLTKLKHANNTFRAWADATPIQNRFIDALTGADLHLIATLRSKTEYVVETNERGKATPRKVGTAPIQREGVEYEFDLFGELDQENTLAIHKSRCPPLSGAVIPRPGRELAAKVRAWLEGAAPPQADLPPPLRIQASVGPVLELPERASNEPRRASTESAESGAPPGEPSTVDQAGADSVGEPSAAPGVVTPRKSLTERARELGYEGEAWMALVYRITGKREPRALTAQDKSRLAAYLGHLAKLGVRRGMGSTDADTSEPGAPHPDATDEARGA